MSLEMNSTKFNKANTPIPFILTVVPGSSKAKLFRKKLFAYLSLLPLMGHRPSTGDLQPTRFFSPASTDYHSSPLYLTSAPCATCYLVRIFSFYLDQSELGLASQYSLMVVHLRRLFLIFTSIGI